MFFKTALKTLIFSEVLNALFNGVLNNFHKLEGTIQGKQLQIGMKLSKIEIETRTYNDCFIVGITEIHSFVGVVALSFTFERMINNLDGKISISNHDKKVTKYYLFGDFYSRQHRDRFYL